VKKKKIKFKHIKKFKTIRLYMLVLIKKVFIKIIKFSIKNVALTLIWCEVR